MFLNNTTKQDIGPISYEGYEFILPPGVFWVWDEAGQHMMDNLYRMRGEGGGMPPVIKSSEEDWDGRSAATVTRFQVLQQTVPHVADLIRLAKKRGVDPEFLESAQEEGADVDAEDLVNAINQLPVPDEVRTPPIGEEVAADEDPLAVDEADNDGEHADPNAVTLSLEDLSVPQLRNLAKERGIELPKSNKKDDILALLNPSNDE